MLLLAGLSLSDLGEYIDAKSLPESFGGEFKYDHEKWVQERVKTESKVRVSATKTSDIAHNLRIPKNPSSFVFQFPGKRYNRGIFGDQGSRWDLEATLVCCSGN